MTMRELSQLYWLNKELERYEHKLSKLRYAIGPSSPSSDGMPRGSNMDSATERRAVELVELQEIIEEIKTKIHRERKALLGYIDSIPDSYTRLIFSYRFMDGLTWQQVALRIGGRVTADAVRKACIRYLEAE